MLIYLSITLYAEITSGRVFPLPSWALENLHKAQSSTFKHLFIYVTARFHKSSNEAFLIHILKRACDGGGGFKNW